MNKTVLIVDDDAQIRSLLQRYLVKEGFEVFAVANGDEMRETLARHAVHIVVLDVRLPGEDGFSLLRQLRTGSPIRIIMLSDRAEVLDRVAGLEAGADDYVSKPFEPRELLARIHAVLRRNSTTTVDADEDVPPILRFNDFSLNLASRELRNPAGEEVVLTPMEFDLLATLAQKPQRALDRDYLIEAVMGDQSSAMERTVDVHIGRLRKKIELNSAEPSMIKTVRGAGYIFTAKVARES